MPRLLLVQPLYENEKLDRNVKTVYPIGLGYLAAYVPARWDVRIVDEQIEPVDFGAPADLVGISTTTLTANRSYEIAGRFRARGVKVVLGGVHASMCAEEAKQYCDAVCIGDGEHLIGKILEDVEAGRLQQEYRDDPQPLEGLRRPRRDLFTKDYTFLPVSTSRGCPFNCSFCAINKFYKGRYRLREVDEVIAEMVALPRGHDIVFVTDGNMYGYLPRDVDRFKEICRRLAVERRRGNLPFKYFTCYASVNALDDDEALVLAAQAGCVAMFVGFESIDPKSLKDMNKRLNLKYGPDSYGRLVENAQKKRILIVGEMLVGMDSDTEETLRLTEDFIRTINFDLLRLQIAQPLPGTKMFEKLEAEGRLYLKDFPADWNKLRDGFLVGVHYKIKQLDDRRLQRWVKRMGLEFYSPQNIVKRAWKTYRNTGSARMAAVAAKMNFKSRKSYANLEV